MDMSAPGLGGGGGIGAVGGHLADGSLLDPEGEAPLRFVDHWSSDHPAALRAPDDR